MIKISFLILGTLLLLSCGPTDHLRLAEMAKNDQQDRKENNPQISKNDMERLREVKEILDNDTLKTSNDYFHAAIILQHGEEPSDYKTANELAQKAVEINQDNEDAKRLIAQSMDRYLLSINKPQIYGTQRISLGSLEYLHEIDTTMVSDAERMALGVFTLKQNLDYFNDLHQKNKTQLWHYQLTDSLYKAYYPDKKADLIGTFEELLSNIQYPKKALDKGITGKVLVEYTITPEGNTKNILVVDGIGHGCDEEAIRIISIAKYKNYLNRDIERRTRILFEIKN